MISKKYIGLLIMFFCTFFTATGQLFFKYSSANFRWGLELLQNYYLLLGFFFYGLGAFLLIIALKFGDLSFLYPIVSLTFVWVMFISYFILQETIDHFKISGVLFIILGVMAITRGEHHG